MQQIACNESLHLTTALCKHKAVWFCLFHRLKYTKTHAKRQLHKLLITRPWKKSVLLQQKVEKRGSQNVNVFARAYFVTHKFLTANIGYAYLFQLFGFHKSLAFCFRVSLALRILAFFSLVHFFVEKWSNSAKTWENNEKSRNKGHLLEKQKFQQNANWNKTDEHIKN